MLLALFGTPSLDDSRSGRRPTGECEGLEGEAAAQRQRYASLSVVGDDDQSIYSWRDAAPQAFVRFATAFPGGSEVRLVRNYRSTGSIVAAAAASVAGIRGRAAKTLWTGRPRGAPLRLVRCATGYSEADFVAGLIAALVRPRPASGGASGAGDRLETSPPPPSARSASAPAATPTPVPPREIAVLCRSARPTLHIIEKALLRAGVPCAIAGSRAFFDRPMIKAALAYMRLALNELDDAALLECVNVPSRGLGAAALAALREAAAPASPGGGTNTSATTTGAAARPLLGAARALATGRTLAANRLSMAQRRALRGFVNVIEGLFAHAVAGGAASMVTAVRAALIGEACASSSASIHVASDAAAATSASSAPTSSSELVSRPSLPPSDRQKCSDGKDGAGPSSDTGRTAVPVRLRPKPSGAGGFMQTARTGGSGFATARIALETQAAPEEQTDNQQDRGLSRDDPHVTKSAKESERADTERAFDVLQELVDGRSCSDAKVDSGGDDSAGHDGSRATAGDDEGGWGVADASSFLDDIALASAREDVRTEEEGGTGDGGHVTLCTIHKAKGLEWDHVFLVGTHEGGLPTRPRGSHDEASGRLPRAADGRALVRDDDAHHDEERRLFHVAITRARDAFVATHAARAPSRDGGGGGGDGGYDTQRPSSFFEARGWRICRCGPFASASIAERHARHFGSVIARSTNIGSSQRHLLHYIRACSQMLPRSVVRFEDRSKEDRATSPPHAYSSDHFNMLGRNRNVSADVSEAEKPPAQTRSKPVATGEGGAASNDADIVAAAVAAAFPRPRCAGHDVAAAIVWEPIPALADSKSGGGLRRRRVCVCALPNVRACTHRELYSEFLERIRVRCLWRDGDAFAFYSRLCASLRSTRVCSVHDLVPPACDPVSAATSLSPPVCAALVHCQRGGNGGAAASNNASFLGLVEGSARVRVDGAGTSSAGAAVRIRARGAPSDSNQSSGMRTLGTFFKPAQNSSLVATATRDAASAQADQAAIGSTNCAPPSHKPNVALMSSFATSSRLPKNAMAAPTTSRPPHSANGHQTSSGSVKVSSGPQATSVPSAPVRKPFNFVGPSRSVVTHPGLGGFSAVPLRTAPKQRRSFVPPSSNYVATAANGLSKDPIVGDVDAGSVLRTAPSRLTTGARTTAAAGTAQRGGRSQLQLVSVNRTHKLRPFVAPQATNRVDRPHPVGNRTDLAGEGGHIGSGLETTTAESGLAPTLDASRSSELRLTGTTPPARQSRSSETAPLVRESCSSETAPLAPESRPETAPWPETVLTSALPSEPSSSSSITAEAAAASPKKVQSVVVETSKANNEHQSMNYAVDELSEGELDTLFNTIGHLHGNAAEVSSKPAVPAAPIVVAMPTDAPSSSAADSAVLPAPALKSPDSPSASASFDGCGERCMHGNGADCVECCSLASRLASRIQDRTVGAVASAKDACASESDSNPSSQSDELSATRAPANEEIAPRLSDVVDQPKADRDSQAEPCTSAPHQSESVTEAAGSTSVDKAKADCDSQTEPCTSALHQSESVTEDAGVTSVDKAKADCDSQAEPRHVQSKKPSQHKIDGTSSTAASIKGVQQEGGQQHVTSTLGRGRGRGRGGGRRGNISRGAGSSSATGRGGSRRRARNTNDSALIGGTDIAAVGGETAGPSENKRARAASMAKPFVRNLWLTLIAGVANERSRAANRGRGGRGRGSGRSGGAPPRGQPQISAWFGDRKRPALSEVTDHANHANQRGKGESDTQRT